MDSATDRGVIYLASQHVRFLCEAVASAKTARHRMPGVSLSLFTDLPILFDRSIEPFERVIPLAAATETALPHGRAKLAKVRSVARSPYERTLFLDSDTRVLGDDVPLLFDLLDECEFAAVACTPAESRSCALYGPMFNTGVVAFRRNEKTRDLFRAWEESMLFHLRLTDPQAIRAVPYLSRLDAGAAAFLMATDQLSLAQTLSPERNDLDVRACLLDESWNARDRAPDDLQCVRVDHANRHKVPPRDADRALVALGFDWLRGSVPSDG